MKMRLKSLRSKLNMVEVYIFNVVSSCEAMTFIQDLDIQMDDSKEKKGFEAYFENKQQDIKVYLY